MWKTWKNPVRAKWIFSITRPAIVQMKYLAYPFDVRFQCLRRWKRWIHFGNVTHFLRRNLGGSHTLNVNKEVWSELTFEPFPRHEFPSFVWQVHSYVFYHKYLKCSVIKLNNWNTHLFKVMVVIGTFHVVVRRNPKYFNPLAHVNLNFFYKRLSLLLNIQC